MHLNSSANPATVGTSVTLRATVTPNPGGGAVEWRDGGALVASSALDVDGAAAIVIIVAAGSTSYSATFTGAPGWGASSATLVEVGRPALPAACAEEAATAASIGVTADGVRAGRVTMMGSTATINPATSNFSTTPVPNGPFAMWYRSLVWLAPIAADAFETGNAADAALVTAYVRAAVRTSPDPGSATAAALARANASGWDEGTNLRREQLLNCLVQAIPSDPVRGLLDAAIAANLDAKRYYGLPYHAPHNHGLMANLTLLDSARILDRPGLTDAAQARLLTDSRAVVDASCWMVFEQSSAYQSFNARVWAQAARALAAQGRTDAANILAQRTAGMANAYALLVTPGGRDAAIGDSQPLAAGTSPGAGLSRLLCRTAGWAAARSNATSAATQYTFRFGPARKMHGHDDHGSVTWYPGRSVLVDPGYFFDGASSLGRSAVVNAAHNVIGVAGIEFSGATALTYVSITSGVHTYDVRDQASGVTRTRGVRADLGLPLLAVLDRVRATRRVSATQRWHFDSSWRWDAVHGRFVNGPAVAGVVAMDLRTGRLLPVSKTSGVLFPTTAAPAKGPVLNVVRTGASADIFTVVYTSPNGARPRLEWHRGALPGTGIMRIWWGRIHRDVRIDGVGIR